MSPEEILTLESFLRKEFRGLHCEQEAAWVMKELANADLGTAQERAEEILSRRKEGEPLAYILGHWDFRKLRLSLGPGVLIPRPETEELVDLALEHIEKSPKDILRIADWGAGSGAIAYSILLESKKTVEVYAVEKSKEAFFWLEKNKPLTHKNKIHLRLGSWNDFDVSDLDLIVSNPPYVSASEFALLEHEVKNFEPSAALVPEDQSNAYSAYESIFERAKMTLGRGGAVLCEFGPAQNNWNTKLFSSFNAWRTFKDLSSKERFLYAFDFKEKSR